MASKLLAITYASLFFAGVSGFVVCVVMLLHDSPWNFDALANAKILGLVGSGELQQGGDDHHAGYINNSGIDDFLLDIKREKGVDLHSFLKISYTFSLFSALANSLFVLAIVLSAPRNTILVLFTQIVISGCTGAAYLLNPEENKDSVHTRLVATVFYFSSLGLLSHLLYIFTNTDSDTTMASSSVTDQEERKKVD